MYQNRLQTKSIKGDGEEHFILIARKIDQNEVSILNICVPNTIVRTYIKETLLKLKSHINPPQTNSRKLQQHNLTKGKVYQRET